MKITVTCLNCETEKIVPFKERRRKFCGHSCAAAYHNRLTPCIAHLAKYNREFGDRVRGTGTKTPYVKLNGRHEHRVVMERVLGRPLASSEIVHHDDENGKHNAQDNLVLTTRREHQHIHFKGKKRNPKSHCKRGHEFSSENTRTNKSGKRVCRACSSAYQRERYIAERAEEASCAY